MIYNDDYLFLTIGGIAWFIIISVVICSNKINSTNNNYPKTQLKYIKYSEMV